MPSHIRPTWRGNPAGRAESPHQERARLCHQSRLLQGDVDGQRRGQGRAEQCRRTAPSACRGPQHSDHAGSRCARRRRRTASQAWPRDKPVQARPHGHPPSVSIDTLPLESERCWRLALAVYELVTNAVRHACFDGRDGEIKIKLMRAGSWVNCRVADNGSGLTRIKPVGDFGSLAIWQKAWVAGWNTPSARHRPRSFWTSLSPSASGAPTAQSPPAVPEPPSTEGRCVRSFRASRRRAANPARRCSRGSRLEGETQC